MSLTLSPIVATEAPVTIDYSPLKKSPFRDAMFCDSATTIRRKVPRTFTYFTHLPYEIQYQILRFLSYKDVCSVQQTCKHLQELSLEKGLWKRLTLTHFGVDEDVMLEFGKNIKDWRGHFKLQCALYKKGCVTATKIQSANNKPRPRFAHTGCSVANKIVYIGGQMAEGRSNEIWSYDPKSNSFDANRISNFDPTRKNDQTDVSDDCKNYQGVQGTVPAFARHQSALIGNKIYTFGGYDYTYFYNLSVFDTKLGTWTYPKVTGDIPCPRSNHSSAVVGNKFYVFGGSVGDNVDKYTVTEDFYSLDTKTFVWTKIQSVEPSDRPTRRVGHVMTAIGKHIYLFGGGVWGKVTGWTQQYNDLYIYSTEENKWTLVPLKSGEKPPICTYPYIFAVANNVFVFGGASITGSTVTNQMFMWDILARKWTEIMIEGDEITSRSIGAANLVNNEIFMWGGYCGGILPSDNDFFKLKLNFKCSLDCLGSS